MSSNRLMTRVSSLRRRNTSRREESMSTVSRALSSVLTGLQTPCIFQSMDQTEEVATWLRTMGLEQYIPVFQANAVTGDILLSLNSVELQKSLGITNLTDRRRIMDGISYLAQTLCSESKRDIPEDGRILTHLSNERIFLVWVRFTIILQTVAIATLRLQNLEHSENLKHIHLTCFVLSALAILAVLYGAYRYHKMQCMVENPGVDNSPNRILLIAPALIASASVIAAIYALMANSTEDAAALALLAV